ncbi:hypothetical protein EON63_22955, partial [archaeon]
MTSQQALCSPEDSPLEVMTEDECRTAMGSLYLPHILSSCGSITEQIDVQAVYDAYKHRTDTYILHDGEDMDRVTRIANALEARGLRVSMSPTNDENNLFSSFSIEEVYKQVMCYVDRTHCVLVCITPTLTHHIHNLNPHTHSTHACQMAFTYAEQRKGLHYMLPVVMSREMRDSKDWGTQVGRVGTGKVRVDLSDVVGDAPYIIYHIPYTIYHIPYTIYHIPYTIYHIPYTIYHIPYT